MNNARRIVTDTTAHKFADARDWWTEARLGIFVHWGPYALGGWHEQELWRRRLQREAYVARSMTWNPQRFDPDAWIDLAENFGAKYLCVTTKHHDGFCLWDSALTDYKITRTPYGKDLVRLLVDACHRRSMPIMLYYSVVDWHHPSYPNLGRHHELPPRPEDRPDWSAYVAYLRGQVRELCTNYGEIHGIWWDMNVPEHVDPSVNDMIRSLQPKAVVNNRGFDTGDFGTPERDYHESSQDAPTSFARCTEACQSVGIESWSWRVDEDYYTQRHLQRSVDKYLARGANYLLNVGPDPQGVIPDIQASIVRKLGQWFGRIRESFTEVTPVSHLTRNHDVLLTRRGDTLYVHLWRDPRTSAVKLGPLDILPERATLLNDGSPVTCVVDMPPSEHVTHRPVLRLRNLPVDRLSNTVLVVRLDFAPGLLDAADEATSPRPSSNVAEDDIRVQ